MDVEDIEQYLGYMNQYLSTIDSDTSAMRTTLSGINNHLVDIKDYYYYYENKELGYFRAFSNLLARAQQGSGSDILASNPWWATNSMFGTFQGWRSSSGANGYDGLSEIFPEHEDGLPPTHMTFPQFMSLWGMRLNGGAARPSANISLNWQDWGVSALTNGSMNVSKRSLRGYTWFDMIADAWKSNLVLQSSIAREGWTNDFENTAWVLNHFDYAMGDVTNLLGSMAGASDPWWSTNSAFAMTYKALSLVAPQLLPSFDGEPGIQGFYNLGMSFPEYMSFRAALENRGAADIYQQFPFSPQDAVGWWGADSFENYAHSVNYTRQATFTFEDWLATMLRTNLVLTMGTYANSYSNLIADAAAHGYADYSQPTNVPLPEYEDLVSEAQSEAASSEMSSAEEKMSEVVTALSGMIQTPNSEITVIPEFTVGGIHVSEQKFDFDNTVATVGRRIMNFVWYVALFASMFALLESEWAYYVNLGRTWTTSGGFLKSRGGP